MDATERQMVKIILWMLLLFVAVFLLLAVVPAEWLDRFFPEAQ